MSLQHEFLPVTLTPLVGVAQPPTLTGLQSRPEGGLFVSAVFGHPYVQHLELSADGTLSRAEDLKLEDEVGEDAYGVSSPLRSTENGDAPMVVLHPGTWPRFLRKVFGKDMASLKGERLLSFLASQDTDFGFFSQHSVCKYRQGKWEIRRFQEPGFLWDIAFIGDFVFGMKPRGFYREPYLHLQPEKRELMRKDLLGNRAVHRSQDGTFWMVGANGRLARFQYTEHKAKPTTRVLPGLAEDNPLSGIGLSAASRLDGWLYGVSGARQEKLFRVRRNPISFEEEIQELVSLDAPITGLCVQESEEGSEGRVLFAVARPGSAELLSVTIRKPEDPEDLPKIEPWAQVGVVGVPCLSALTMDLSRPGVLWAVEGDLQRPAPVPRLVKVSLS